MDRAATDPPSADVAVIVPSFNRPERLRGCLGALMALQGPAPEIVVVDDGSTQPLAPVCAEFGTRVRCLRQRNRGPAAARNAGVRATGAGFVAFTDDDCRPRPDWLARLTAAHRGDAARLVGGRVENALDDNPYAAASQSLCDYLYEYFGAAAGEAPFFTSNNMGCDRATFERLGGVRRELSAGRGRRSRLRPALARRGRHAAFTRPQRWSHTAMRSISAASGGSTPITAGARGTCTGSWTGGAMRDRGARRRGSTSGSWRIRCAARGGRGSRNRR